MRVDIEAFLSRYDRPPPPAEIRQLPLDGDDGHYARLCALDGARPTDRDFGDYADDIAYMPEVQADLFAHLIPACLQTWRRPLTRRVPEDGRRIPAAILSRVDFPEPLLPTIPTDSP